MVPPLNSLNPPVVGKRTDNQDLVQVLLDRGYTFIRTRAELQGLPGTVRKVWGLFLDDALAYDFDRQELAPTEPSLGETTRKAIEILSKNPRGFFLFVESSKVDRASHANDPIGVLSDVFSLDDALSAALDFASKDRNTLVLAFADHWNGGTSIGSKASDANYSSLSCDRPVDKSASHRRGNPGEARGRSAG